MIGNRLTPFKFWCQKVLPTVYDDSLSYYEYLNKLNEYLNEVIEQINTLTEAEENFQTDLSAQWTAYKNGLNAEWLEYKTGLTQEWNTYRTQLTQAWTETKNYIDHYFDNLNVQTEINNKLDAMVLNGTMSDLIEGVISDDIPTTVTTWLTEHVDPVGSAVVVDNTLSITGAAADAKVTGDAIEAIETNLDENYPHPVIVSKNIFNKNTVVEGYYLNENGVITQASGWWYSDKIDATGITNIASRNAVCFYTNADVFISRKAATTVTTSVPNNCAYFRSTGGTAGLANAQINVGTELLEHDDYRVGYLIEDIKDLKDTLDEKVNIEDTLIPSVHSPNIFDKSKITTGYYIDSSGNVAPAEGWFYSEKIPIEASTTYTKNCRIAVYTENGTLLDYNPPTTTSMTTGATASYCIITGTLASLINYYLIKGTIVPSDTSYYVKFGREQVDGIRVQYVVDVNGGGDYTSLARCFYEHKGQNCDVIVRKGTYDLITEYEDVYGATYFDEFSSSSLSKMGEGLPIYGGMRVLLDSDAVVLFDYSAGTNPEVTHYFSAFKFDKDGGEIHGGKVVVYNARYAIHDDVYSYASSHSKSVIDGVYVFRDNGSAIGGGMGKATSVEIKNCIIINNAATPQSGWALFYHNGTEEGVNRIVIHGNYCQGKILIESYGPSGQDTSIALVNNNVATGGVEHTIADPINNIRNIKMIAWNNVTTAS